jgi:predicted metal-binding protein
MEAWKSVSMLKEFEDYRFIKAPVPTYKQANYDLAFEKCKENKCGSYNTNWGCNPGAKMDVAKFYEGMDYVVIMCRRFEVDYHDSELFHEVTEDMQRSVRRFVLKLRDNGVGCHGFMDGPCLYCGKCAYPEPCRFPDMLLPSVSTLGIGLKEYFESFGESFSFEEGVITLYGFVFIEKS